VFKLFLFSSQALRVYFVLVMLAISHFVLKSIEQITRTLGIYCLSLGARPEGKQNVPKDIVAAAVPSQPTDTKKGN
jgi:hypothetical protein